MEKRIKYSQFQQVKSAAKLIDPLKRKMAPLKKKVEAMVAEMKGYQVQIDAYEAGIVTFMGFHVDELVKKVIEPTGKTDANGKPITVTKYIPTDIVTYDEQKKEYVITLPDAPTSPTASETVTPPPASAEDQAEAPADVDVETSEVNDASFLDA